MLLAETVKPRKRAVIYCRVSTDKQEQDGESLEYEEMRGRYENATFKEKRNALEVLG